MNLQSSLKTKVWIYGIMVLISLIFTTQQAADYRIYVAAGRVMIDEKANPFLDEDMIETEPDGKITPHAQYRYAPIFGIALYPISLLPKQVYIFLWLFFNAFLLYKSVLLFREFFSELKSDTKLFGITAIVTLILGIRFWGQNLQLGQTTILLVFLSVYALHLSRKNKPVLAGLMLALAIVTKIMPLLLIGYFIYRKDFKTPIFTIIFTVLLVYLPALIVGFDYNNFLIQEWYNIINPANKEYTLETKTGIYNLSAFIFAYFTEMPDDKITGNRNILSLSYEVAGILTNIIRGALILFTLYFVRSLPFKAAKSSVHAFWEFGYICLAFPLVFPAQNKYSFYYILPALFFITYYMVKRYKTEGGLRGIPMKILIPMALYFIITTLTSSNIIGKYWYDQTQFYKVITFGIIALIVAYAQVKPSMLNTHQPENNQ
ncbi:glycosyltransferase family 87 protein [uncultured Roseivirga sp.]|uniref:glycosyltransferase family 87 protein n=1 Tax=uncultured Roseivirga sp. TaxID=543088 RepID=UPI0030DA8657|tara:strand:+ start:2058 stop:3353 length:1296 start_codon:yes stop_codon:yes gene_type:complete